MRFTLGLLASALTLLLASAVGVVGAWAAPTGAVLMAVGAVCCAVVLEAASPSGTGSATG
jgi:hypothetical protein